MESKAIYRYPGSRPFEDTDFDRRLFFGREREKDDLLQKIIARKLVVLHAESGLGKTSLLNAGVSSLLRERGFLPIKIRFNMANISPVQAVFSGIEEAAAQQRLDIEPGENETLWHYFKTAAFWSTDDNLLTPVLILDQFEEFFAFHEPEVRGVFISQLADLVHNTIPQGLRQAIRTGEPYRYGDEPPRVKIVISIRSDFMGQLDELSSDIPEIMDNRYRLLALTRQQAREAITGPAQIQDEQMFSRRFRYSKEALDMMLDYLSKRRERGGVVIKDEVESFQLQLLCRHIETNVLEKPGRAGDQHEFEVKEEDLGGVAGMHKVFQYFYEDRLAGLKSALEKHRVRRLCEKGLISDSNRRLSLEEEVIEKQFKVSAVLLAQLVDNRLLRSENRVGSVYYELSHDTLIAPILLSQLKRRITIEKHALVFIIPIFIIFIILLSLDVLKQNELDKLFIEAEQQASASNSGKTIEIYKKILEEDPKNIRANVKLGELLYGFKKYEDAIQLYKKAIDNKITDVRLYSGLLKILSESGKEVEAIDYINEAIKRNPGQTEAHEALGDYYATKKEFRKIASDNYEKIIAINKEDIGVYKKLVVVYLEIGEKEKILDLFKRAVTADVDFVKIYDQIRAILKQKNDKETLEELYETALSIKSLKVYEQLAVYYVQIGEKERAIEIFNRATTVDVENVKVYEDIRDVLKQKNDTETLEKLYGMALRVNSKYYYNYFLLGNDYSDLKNYEAAIACYRKALELNPDFAEGYNNLGKVFRKKGDYKTAIEIFQKALELSPDNFGIYNNIGNAQYNKRDYDAAIASYRRALELNPYDAGVYNNMGVTQYNKGDYTAAIASYQKALEIRPTDLLTKENLVELYLITEHLDKAMELAYQVLKEKDVPQDQILAMRSIVISSLFCQGNQTQALMELKQLIMVYRGLTNDFKRDWDYSETKKFIIQTKRLNEPTRALLLKMIALLEAPKKEGDKILVELEKMAGEFKI